MIQDRYRNSSYQPAQLSTMTEVFFGWCLSDLPAMKAKREHVHRAIDLLYLIEDDPHYRKLLIDWACSDYSPRHDGIVNRTEYMKESDHFYHIGDPRRGDNLLSVPRESLLNLYLVVETEERPQVKLGYYYYGDFGQIHDLSCHKTED